MVKTHNRHAVIKSPYNQNTSLAHSRFKTVFTSQPQRLRDRRSSARWAGEWVDARVGDRADTATNSALISAIVSRMISKHPIDIYCPYISDGFDYAGSA